MRPKTLAITPTCGSYFGDLRWSTWGTGMATASGYFFYDTMVKAACPGPYVRYPASVTLYDEGAGEFFKMVTVVSGGVPFPGGYYGVTKWSESTSNWPW